jgi:hypothetical protein
MDLKHGGGSPIKAFVDLVIRALAIYRRSALRSTDNKSEFDELEKSLVLLAQGLGGAQG